METDALTTGAPPAVAIRTVCIPELPDKHQCPNDVIVRGDDPTVISNPTYPVKLLRVALAVKLVTYGVMEETGVEGGSRPITAEAVVVGLAALVAVIVTIWESEIVVGAV
jgi:hypothetical protein